MSEFEKEVLEAAERALGSTSHEDPCDDPNWVTVRKGKLLRAMTNFGMLQRVKGMMEAASISDHHCTDHFNCHCVELIREVANRKWGNDDG